MCIVLIGSMKLVDYKFDRLVFTPVYSGCQKIWAHRGNAQNHTPNSIESVNAAFDSGAIGTEIDVYFDLETEDYIVSHDYPYNLKNGRVLRLEEVFENVSNKYYYWLDFKNLKNLSEAQATSALGRLIDLLDKFALNKQVVVESTHSANLALFTSSNIFTSYWIRPRESSGWFSFMKRVYRYKLNLIMDKHAVISMNQKYYTEKVAEVFSNVPTHLFTVNTEERMKALLNSDDVKIVLTDGLPFTMSVCSEGKG